MRDMGVEFLYVYCGAASFRLAEGRAMRSFLNYFKRRAIQQENDAQRTYPVLEKIAVLQKICAALFLVVGLLSGFIIPVFQSRNWAVGIAFLTASVVQFVILWALAELIYIFLDIEANTRSILLIEQNTRSIARKGLADFLLGSDVR